MTPPKHRFFGKTIVHYCEVDNLKHFKSDMFEDSPKASKFGFHETQLNPNIKSIKCPFMTTPRQGNKLK